MSEKNHAQHKVARGLSSKNAACFHKDQHRHQKTLPNSRMRSKQGQIQTLLALKADFFMLLLDEGFTLSQIRKIREAIDATLITVSTVEA